MKNCLLILAALLLPFYIGCGASFSSTDSDSTATGTTATAICASGYVYTTTYGCLPQSTCATGYAMYNNTCVSTTSTTTTTTTGTTSSTTCSTGYVYSTTYGCIPQLTCSTGYGWYNNNCILLTGTVVTTVNHCQDYCPIGQIATDYGCMPADPVCPPCSGLGPDGYCYWSSYTLNTGLTY